MHRLHWAAALIRRLIKRRFAKLRMIRNQVAALCSIFAFFGVFSANNLLSCVDYLLVWPRDPSVRAGLPVSLRMAVVIAAGLLGFDAEDEKRLFATHFSSSFTADHGKS